MSDFFLLGVGPVRSDKPFIHNEIQYPAYWLARATPEELDSIGAVAITRDPKPDERFYIVVEDASGPHVTYTTKARELEPLKEQFISAAKQTAGSLLGTTDWMVTRHVEDPAKPVPPEVLAQRSSIRAASNAYEELVNACATVEELAAVPDFSTML